MAMGASVKIVLLLSLLSFFTCNTHATDCVYTFFIKTGTRISAGTNAVINVTLLDSSGDSVTISDIESWGGLMGDDYNYFERGNIDIFSGTATCTSTGTICALNLTSDGSGSHPGWYVNYVDATITGAGLGCTNVDFDISQWVADDAYPYELYAFRDYCSDEAAKNACGGRRKTNATLETQ
ncbi:hypothetical protein KP509_07G064500 [Ceratopteris richardii]|uniref:PLAT domain-containing protein n=1 Tax=Ceratopteris richardii TaxID=49495 RepID=A0A8T2UAP5_CERRI|nr:hypothetical protein KP509_07G064500 [Ceratopteris richardii]